MSAQRIVKIKARLKRSDMSPLSVLVFFLVVILDPNNKRLLKSIPIPDSNKIQFTTGCKTAFLLNYTLSARKHDKKRILMLINNPWARNAWKSSVTIVASLEFIEISIHKHFSLI